MQCISCGATMPFIDTEPTSFGCVYCSGTQYPDAVDLLSQETLGFVHEVRPGQVALAEGIGDNIRDAGAALYEAGTGVGKSFAYLLPAILSGKRTVISTAKKSLQAQLYDKDLPYIKEQLRKRGHPRSAFKFFFGYGKSNYACRLRITKDKAGTKEWPKYEKFLNKSTYGRWEDGEKLRLKLDTSMSAEDCVGADCRHYKRECGYVAARKELLEADVVVTNNWLLGYHYRLRREMPNYFLLGEFSHLIVDEAHKIEDGIRSAFKNETNLNFTVALRKQFETLQARAEKHVTLPDLDRVLEPTWQKAFEGFQRANAAGTNTLTISESKHVSEVIRRISVIADYLLDDKTLDDVFKTKDAPPRSLLRTRWTDSATVDKTPDVTQLDTALSGPSPGFPSDAEDQLSFMAVDKIINSLKSARDTLQMVLESPANRTWTITKNIYNGKTNFYLASLPINIGSYLPEKEITYLSATLALNGDFRDFAGRVGLYHKPYASQVYPSPFNMRKQAHLFVPSPKNMPVPATKEGVARDLFRTALGEHIYKLAMANKGNAFVLFSSNEELASVEQYLSDQDLRLPVISQLNMSPEEALIRYRETDNAVLLGSKSFWEGVDVSGDKLSLVIIAKLPFPNTKDPIVKARKAAIDTSDTDNSSFPFVDLPDMLFDLRQGIGRLIRTTSDTGVIAILDQRIYTKSYGKAVVDLVGLNPHNNLDKICLWMANRAR